MRYVDFAPLVAALESGKIPGVILWRGPSAVDGSPIVLVANKFDAGSDNEKTGAMVQTFVLPDPVAAGIVAAPGRPGKISDWLATTGGVSICGDCPHAWQLNAETGAHEKGSCYVQEYRAPAAVLGAVLRGSYPIAGVDFPARWIRALGANRAIRAGSYGDPAACAPQVWLDFLGLAEIRTGYTHFWKSVHPMARDNAHALRSVLMASCDNMADYTAATAAGFRAFLVTPAGSVTAATPSLYSVGAHVPGAMICPASKEFEDHHGRRTSCLKCGACSGATGKGATFPNVFIPAHGSTRNRFAVT